MGVARDTDPAQVRQYQTYRRPRPHLGENGIWLSGGIPLADAGSQVNMAFKNAAEMKTVGVDNAFM